MVSLRRKLASSMVTAAVGVGAIDMLVFFICSVPAAGLSGALSRLRAWRLTEIRA